MAVLAPVLRTPTTRGRPGSPASSLGFLLHEHPAQAFTTVRGTAHGTAHVFHPEASGSGEADRP
ncbi:hypothetical protein G3I34_24825 [Streptomyces sp. SID8014]|nr:hypothetical protein [Streptomyces sp. SID8014]